MLDDDDDDDNGDDNDKDDNGKDAEYESLEIHWSSRVLFGTSSDTYIGERNFDRISVDLR